MKKLLIPFVAALGFSALPATQARADWEDVQDAMEDAEEDRLDAIEDAIEDGRPITVHTTRTTYTNSFGDRYYYNRFGDRVYIDRAPRVRTYRPVIYVD